MYKPKHVTMIDVAKAADVSHQTVSRVINDHPRVASETRERVQKVIQELNYRPNRVARSLAAKQTRTLALVAYDMSYYGPTQMVINIEKAARSAGYDMFFANIDPEASADIVSIANLITERSVDGALLIAPVLDIQYSQMIDQLTNIPVLQIDIAQGANAPSVVIDQRLGGYIIVKHLIELGHREICEIMGPMNWHGAIARHLGFQQALDEHGLHVAGSVEGDWTAVSGYEMTRQLLQKTHFTAIASANDQMALGAMSCLREQNLSVPHNVAVTGFDDIPEAQFFDPPLTTIRQDFAALGRKGLEYLIEMIEHPDVYSDQRIIDPVLVVRGSSP
jgi:LacI family transcriptional regulator